MAHVFRTRKFDFIVIGAGPAGAATAAALLKRNAGASVALLEMGYGHQPPAVLKAPLARAMLPFLGHFTKRHTTTYETDEEPGLAKRKLTHTRGTCFGGNSVFDSNWALRGTVGEHLQWEAPEWTYDKLLPYHMKLERSLAVDDPLHHGTDGPIVVGAPSAVNLNLPMSLQFAHACEVGMIPPQKDVNGGENVGLFSYQSRVDRGIREDVFRKLVADEIHVQKSLTLHDAAKVEEILLDESGRAVTGVRLAFQGEQIHLESNKVVCCCGAIETPLLLQRSGIGPRDLLAKFKIPVRVENEHVGSNLIEGTMVDVVFKANVPHVERHKSFSPKNIRYLVSQFREWAEQQTGIWGSLEEFGCFLDSRSDTFSPDLHLTMRSLPALTRGEAYYWPHPGFTISVQHCHPVSRGHVRIGGAAAGAKPSILSNHLTEGADVDALCQGMEWVKRLVDSEKLLKHEYYEDYQGFASPLQTFAPVTEAYPGCATGGSEEQVRAMLKQAVCGNGELFGTCAIGKVVDETLAVRGVQGLYVADASVVPVPMAATATTMGLAIGTRCGEALSDVVR